MEKGFPGVALFLTDALGIGIIKSRRGSANGKNVESMQSSLQTQTGVPAWYVIADEQDNIVAGLGVIENDFHKRPDLTPNICAVYVEEAYRMRGLSRKLLDHACRELHQKGIADAYLITTHTRYYEHCGWTFYTMVEEDEGDMVRMYHRKTGLL